MRRRRLGAKYCVRSRGRYPTNIFIIFGHKASRILLQWNVSVSQMETIDVTTNLLPTLDGPLPHHVRFLITTGHILHGDHGSEPDCTVHHRVWQCQLGFQGKGAEQDLLKASFAFANGNFSTMQSTFLISVNSIASSESVA